MIKPHYFPGGTTCLPLIIFLILAFTLVIIPQPSAAEATTLPRIAAGGHHSVALMPDGTLWTWGANWTGQLGNGTTEHSYQPKLIGSDNNWVEVSAGVDHTLALKSDGTLWAWGSNEYGELGIGDQSVEMQKTPVQVGTDSDWMAISSFGHHNIAQKQDGSIWTWGSLTTGTRIRPTLSSIPQHSWVPILTGTWRWLVG